DDSFYTASQTKLEGRAKGYATDQDVFDAVRAQPNLAFVDASVTQPPGFGGKVGLYVKVDIKDNQFEPFDVEIRDPVSGRAQTVKVIGIFSGAVPTNILFGIYVNEETYRSLYGAPDYRTWYLRLADGTGSEQAAKDIKAALVTRGVEATSINEMIDDMLSTSRGFLRIMQAFMGLGLFVGIAALGVIALRSVVERRQQIGMLRAIGYQKGTVALSFLLESGFIALMGILSGVVGATIMSRNLLASGEFSGTSEITFFVPWIEIIGYSTLSFVVALLMTWWPSHRASSVAVADALRYE
ncbi:MAG TPA: FtsX-like permease family protein, partial [Gemmatimonadales bacterium]|nr:FtsX-like permease family protein [Gemmatimonadales bacterium]